eukprot:gnl/MRDRNA2_/MRDRNA2_101160_c0_seq1.p1 gnl/MRDRNA2_/MRDRNA2_101160_c0~~gnl/MRDRNA2_/MRDRNA2_101160_c0_seq1.p1  ORF type:complete len:446 (+),score=70.59 gnl/MRDRNA2_/MRDRNA2_101160_c0_seq1:97-1434(+)
MTLLSKPMTDKEKDATHRRVLEIGAFAVVTQNVQLLNDTALITLACSGNAGQAAAALAWTSSAAGAIEFFMNPIIGKLADQYGRKFIWYIGPILSGVGGSIAILATDGKSLPVLMVHRALNWSLLSASNSFIGPVTISDLYQGQELGLRVAKLFGSYGITIMLAPLIGSLIFQKTNNHMLVYKIRLASAIMQLFYASYLIPETLTEDKVRPFKVSDTNPFRFLKLFTQNRTLTTVSLALFFHCFTEGKNLLPLSQSWINSTPLFWPQSKQSAWTTMYGALIYVAGVMLVPKLTKSLGTRMFTSVTNFFNTIGLAVMGLPLPNYEASLILGTFLHTPGINNTSAACMKAIGTDLAVANGFGRGEYGGMYSSARNFSQFVAPVIFAWAYQRAAATKKPGVFKQGLSFFLVAFFGAVLPELLHRSLSDKDMGISKTEDKDKGGKAAAH